MRVSLLCSGEWALSFYIVSLSTLGSLKKQETKVFNSLVYTVGGRESITPSDRVVSGMNYTFDMNYLWYENDIITGGYVSLLWIIPIIVSDINISYLSILPTAMKRYETSRTHPAIVLQFVQACVNSITGVCLLWNTVLLV